jgi:N-acetylated-alpha-linked acidic dipeptidase
MLKLNGDKYDALLEAVMLKNALDSSRVNLVNQALMRSERVLTNPDGLPHRNWYKHQLSAPGFYTGYGVKTVPAVRESVDDKDWAAAQKHAEVVEHCLAQMNQVVNDAINGLSGM